MCEEKRQLSAFSGSVTLPQALSVIIVGIYVTGFVAINGHLNKRGVVDFGLANSRYLAAGALHLAFLAIWYLFAGRAIVKKAWIAEEIGRATALGLSPIWRFVIAISSITRLVFFTCLSAVAFSFLLLDDSKPRAFYTYLFLLFLIAYPWDFLNLDLRFPRANQLFELLTRAAGLLVFFTMVGVSSPTMAVLLHFGGISLFTNLVLDSFERFRVTSDRIAFDVLYASLFIVLSSAIFGRLHFEYIKSDFGGGQVRPVEIVVGDELERNALRAMGLNVTPFLKANLVHENHQEAVLDIEGRTLRLSRKSITGLRIACSEDTL